MNLFDLTGKTALITGASSGIGERFSRTLSAAGARVILTARSLGKIEVLALQLKNAMPVEMDVSDRMSVKFAFDKLEAEGERIDICINNAAIYKPTPVFAADEQHDFETVMQTNVIGLWAVTQSAAIHMKNHYIQGSIINISSVNGANYLHPERAGYCASKAAVIQMTKALVGELAAEHIRINCIVPGLIHTSATEYKINTEAARQKIEDRIPLHFVATPSDLDGAILFLASNDASRYVTGSCLTIDGGISWGG